MNIDELSKSLDEVERIVKKNNGSVTVKQWSLYYKTKCLIRFDRTLLNDERGDK